MHEHGSHHHGDVAELPRETEGLPDARKIELVELGDGDEFKLEIVPVKKQIGDATVQLGVADLYEGLFEPFARFHRGPA
jgi:hypothetical protein